MKVAIIHNKDQSAVINRLGMQNKELYNPATIKRVAEALEKGGHNVAVIDGNMNVIEQLQAFMPRVMEGERMGMVFNMAYGIQGESRYTHLPSMLEMLGIPYVGSSPAGHTLALDKVTTKIIIQEHGLPTPPFKVFTHPDQDCTGLEFPLIVKPRMEAVSFGLKVVHNEDELREAVAFIIEEFQQHALVETFIRGREFAVGMLGNDPVQAFPILEIDLEKDPDAIQTVEDKKHKPRKKICPAELPGEVAEEMVRVSIAAFHALQLRDFARVDFRMDMDGNIYILEINSMASLGGSGSYVFAAQKAGYPFGPLVNKILASAASRYFPDWKPSTDEKDEKGKGKNGNGRALQLTVRIRSYLRNKQAEIEKNLHRMVNVNSFVRNTSGVNQLGDFVVKQLAPLGFTSRIIPQVEVGSILYADNCRGDLDVLLLGHLDDHVTLPDHVYFSADEQKLHGTGIWTYKGGLAVLIAALQSLRYVRLLKKIRIGILLTTDDTLQGKFARDHVRQLSQDAGCVLGLHGSTLTGGVITSRSGAAVYSCSLKLMKTEKAEDVALAMGIFSRIIQELTGLTNTHGGLVVAPSKTGMKSNITSFYAHGETKLSVRFNSPDQVKLIDERLKKLIPRKYSDIIDFQFEGGIRRPAMVRAEGVEQMWLKLKDIARRLDVRLLEEHRWSSADICFVDSSIPVIDGLGPVGGTSGNNTEYILRHSVLERAALLALAIQELSGVPAVSGKS